MARRKIEEINAGSMADIAFLLLIFFLVATTMEIDTGIARQLPQRNDQPKPNENNEFIKRDVLEISVNSEDELFVEENWIELGELEAIVQEFYTANLSGLDENANMPLYQPINRAVCIESITKIQQELEKNPTNASSKNELNKWKTNLSLCDEMPGGTYMEMKKSALILLENQAGTSYGFYMQIQNILKKVVNELRVEKCEEMGWKEYYTLQEDDPQDQEVIKKLRILVPERIVESKIDR